MIGPITHFVPAASDYSPRIKSPLSFPGLKFYFDGRDLTPASGSAATWTSRGGVQPYNLVGGTIATVGSMRGVIGVKSDTDGYIYSNTGCLLWHYVFICPAITGSAKGVSSAYGRAIPFQVSTAGLQTSRSPTAGGSSSETPQTLIADVSSWAGKMISLVIIHNHPFVLGAAYCVDGVPGYSELITAGYGFVTPTGFVIGGFYGGGGVIETPFFSASVIDGGSVPEAKALAAWGAANWWL